MMMQSFSIEVVMMIKPMTFPMTPSENSGRHSVTQILFLCPYVDRPSANRV
jgi:hypothetical protein